MAPQHPGIKHFFFTFLTLLMIFSGSALAGEVGKGEIPEAQLEKSYTTLDWGVKIWDTDELITAMKSKETLLFVDTRPESFFSKGTINGAINLSYDMKGKEGTLSAETLQAAIKQAGMTKENCKVVFFCQGPKCHRSYNATYTAVTDWGYNPANIIWNREGYPFLFKMVKETPQLKRKAKNYISEAGLNDL